MPLVKAPQDEAGRAELVEDLAARLEAGEVVVLPTDTVYGLVGLARLPSALDRLRALKGRPDAVPIAVLVDDAAQAFALCVAAPPGAARAAARWWPGAVTLVLEAAPDAPQVADDGTIGVRCPDDALVRAVARRVGPLAATSANEHGQPTVCSGAEADAAFGGLLVVDGGERGPTASTVIDCTTDPPAVLRPGPLDPAEVAALLAEG